MEAAAILIMTLTAIVVVIVHLTAESPTGHFIETTKTPKKGDIVINIRSGCAISAQIIEIYGDDVLVRKLHKSHNTNRCTWKLWNVRVIDFVD